MKETNVDSMKYRNSTHLAGVDVEIMIAEQGECLVTIKLAWWETDVMVSGKTVDGYFCTFEENIKPMKLNTTNRKILRGFCIADGLEPRVARNTGSWTGLKINLIFDPTIRMKGEVVGGIRISPVRPAIMKVKPTFTEANFEKAKKAKATLEMIEGAYLITPEVKKKYLAYCDKNK
jgi:hypothetical protein